MTLERTAAYVRSHSFPATVTPDGVVVSIPYTDADGSTGYEDFTVTTLREARDVLGY